MAVLNAGICKGLRFPSLLQMNGFLGGRTVRKRTRAVHSKIAVDVHFLAWLKSEYNRFPDYKRSFTEQERKRAVGMAEKLVRQLNSLGFKDRRGYFLKPLLLLQRFLADADQKYFRDGTVDALQPTRAGGTCHYAVRTRPEEKRSVRSLAMHYLVPALVMHLRSTFGQKKWNHAQELLENELLPAKSRL